MSKPTPGPWKVDYDGPSRPIIVTASRTILSISAYEYGRWGSYDLEEADARLIAAAPELLDALKMLVADREADGYGSEEPALTAKAVIAKATSDPLEPAKPVEFVHLGIGGGM